MQDDRDASSRTMPLHQVEEGGVSLTRRRHTLAISGFVSVDALARTTAPCRALDNRLLAPTVRGCAAPDNDENLANDAAGFDTNIMRVSEMPLVTALKAISLPLVKRRVSTIKLRLSKVCSRTLFFANKVLRLCWKETK